MSSLIKIQPSRHEIIIINICRRNSERANINLRSSAKDNTILIKQHHMAISRDRTVNLRGFMIMNTVKRYRATIWLMKINRLIARYIEACPIYDRFAGRLMDICNFCALSDVCITRSDTTAFRTCICMRC